MAKVRIVWWLLLSAALSGPAASAATPGGAGQGGDDVPIRIVVDATDLDHRVFRVREQIPVPEGIAADGTITLRYPQWLPGNHAPSGRVDRLAGIRFTVDGVPLRWMRQSDDVYAFHVMLPAGARSLLAEFDFLSPTDPAQGRVLMTPEMLNLQWSGLVLYPAGRSADAIRVAAGMRLPVGWEFGSAMARTATREADGSVRFAETDLATLVDSPVFAGRHFHRVELDRGSKQPVTMALVADDASRLAMEPEHVDAHRRLVLQADMAFGARPYDHYEFLVALTDHLGWIGLEHRRSSENRVVPGYFTDWNRVPQSRYLLPHEYVHAWNGKYRSPSGTAQPDYNTPTDNTLLWVYEGQTQYWGLVLGARSGMWTRQQATDVLAGVAARYADDRPGLAWRTMQDTTNDPVAAARRPQSFRSYQLSEDYYSGGQLVWLAVDAKLRELSRDRRSLDDFARAFFGGGDPSAPTRTYGFDDVVAALDAVASHDWAGFLRERVEGHAPPLDGIRTAGWKLVYEDKPNDFQKATEAVDKRADHTYSIGLVAAAGDGRITDVRWNGPAFEAGLAPGMRLVAVGGKAFTPDRLREAVAATAKGTQLVLLVRSGDDYRNVRIGYAGGLRYPHLVRIDGTKDRLGEILAPRR